MVESGTHRFVADAMVGKLARWLRVLGVDVIYDTSLDDHQLVALARSENRILLTRDRPLAAGTNKPQCLLVESENFREQLRQVVETYGIDPNQVPFYSLRRLQQPPGNRFPGRTSATRCLHTFTPHKSSSSAASVATKYSGAGHIDYICKKRSMKSSRNARQDRNSVKDTRTVRPCPFCHGEKVRRECLLRGFTYVECSNCATFRRHPPPAR